ncbi:APC family permease [Streptomyces spirodelae]|uniref:APC family permease n=1 Tax=Streptomyces spirodelae TaxID=2812904 RepID=A0ABS3WWW3_9ACTN|nr:APC family permease [Streptomyces spirodelae]MBO8187548.1 APC family permease [Streptomyces spirodelae]
MSAARSHTARSHTAEILGDSPGGALRRSLTLRDLIVYGLLFIAPMAPVGIYGALDARSHGVVPLVYVVATVAMSFTAYSYARMIRTAPQAGSVYAYARVSLGNGAGFLAGWMMMLDYLLIPAVAYLFSGIAMAQLVPEVDQWVWTALAVVVTTALNLSGVRRAAVVGFLVLAMEILVLLVFVAAALVVLVQDGPQRGWLSPLTGDRAFSLTALLGAVSVAVLSFLGFDAIANFAEEAVGGRGAGAGGEGAVGNGGGAKRDSATLVARAVVWCLLVTGVLFVVQTYLAALLSQDSSRELAEDPASQGAAFYTAAKTAVGGWLQTTVAVSKAIGAAFAALAGQAAAARLLYAMARDRRLPRVLGSVSSRTGVPGRALLLSAVLTLCAAVWAARAAEGLDRLVSIVDIGALFGFGMLHLSVMGYHGLGLRGGRRPGRGAVAESGAGRRGMSPLWDWAVPLVGLGIIVAVLVTANREAHWVGLVWLVIALVTLGVLRRRDSREASG